ncbi:c-type cytochrome [Oxynema aestuarii]|jgi:cytochrome c6|uniref:C-type cytochrome n=1 Tax=Oxynema aestuarii AP17 TaxID=2064643 RepID=A0A6H1TS68_9CYAN|nr:c-type cytochrome [Oxynema aestuarii]QIZ69442.1 c-type cytochrome [Oxynema aestuarii AP17]RMH73132.1 MAG: cytochrome C6 [Cyanobacteria bacterium J007]
MSHYKHWKSWAIAIAAILLIWSGSLPAIAADATSNSVNGAKLFEANCAGCHPNGGNIIRRGKNLRKNTLKRHHLDSLEAIARKVKEGKNPMPAYGDRLSSEQIETVSAYVLSQAERDWK